MAMSRATRYARFKQDDKLEISLFPFLSIFLCVMGVLSFINVLNSSSSISVGLEPLESNWTLNLNPKKESNSKAAN